MIHVDLATPHRVFAPTIDWEAEFDAVMGQFQMLRNHRSGQALWTAEAEETLANSLITLLGFRHAGPQKKVLLKG